MKIKKPPHYIINGAHVAFNTEPSADTIEAVKRLIELAYKTDTPQKALGGLVKPESTMENQSFGQAIEALHQGKRVARAGWNGKGLFIFMQVPSEIGAHIVPNMQSLPESVKAEFARRGGNIRYRNQLAMVYPDNTIYGWVASPSDVLENDWCILD